MGYAWSIQKQSTSTLRICLAEVITIKIVVNYLIQKNDIMHIDVKKINISNI